MENNVENIGKVISAAGAGLLAYFTGLNWELVIIWFGLVTIDIIMGVLLANKSGEYRSRKMKEGLCDKVAEFFLLFALALVQRVAMHNGLNVPVAGVFTGAFCFKEFGSIMETSIKMGINVPESIKKWFIVSYEKIEGGNDSGQDTEH